MTKPLTPAQLRVLETLGEHKVPIEFAEAIALIPPAELLELMLTKRLGCVSDFMVVTPAGREALKDSRP